MKYLVSLDRDATGIQIKVELGLSKTEDSQISAADRDDALRLGNFISMAAESWMMTQGMNDKQRLAYIHEVAAKPTVNH